MQVMPGYVFILPFIKSSPVTSAIFPFMYVEAG